MSDKLTYKELQQYADALKERAQKAENLYQSLFENSHSIMLIIRPDSGEIVDVNRTACSYYGYAKHQITTMKIMDINTLSCEQVFDEMQNAKLEKRKYFNFQHKLANGEIRDVEIFSGPITLNNEKVLYSIIHDISERKKIEHDREQLIEKLEHALAEIKTLRGILPICAACKKIRDDKGYWKQIEAYIKEHSEAEFSHSICPQCAEKLYPDFV